MLLSRTVIYLDLFVQALLRAFDEADGELDGCALDLARSGTTAVLSIVTSEW